MTGPEALRIACSLAIAAWAAVTDLRWHKIKNYTVLTGIGLGLCIHMPDPRSALLGMAIPLLLFPLFAVGTVRAGDVKLLCAVGSIAGYPDAIPILLYSFVLCGIYIALYFLLKGLGGTLLRSLGTDLRYLLHGLGTGPQEGRRRFVFAGWVLVAVGLDAAGKLLSAFR